MYKNRIEVIGYVGQDAEVKATSNGRTFTRISVATSERWKDRDGNRQERTEWHTVTFWGQLAKFAGEYVKKGRHVLIGGPLRSREYEDRDGIRGKVWEIAADELLLLDKAEKRAGADIEFEPGEASEAHSRGPVRRDPAERSVASLAHG